MRRYRTPAIVTAVLLLAAACTGDAAPTTASTTIPPEEITLPYHWHPAWPIPWEPMWKGAEAKGAFYRVQIMGSDWMELQAHFDLGVEWRGETWDRLVLGTVEPGQDGVAMYFSRPEPWVLRLWGVAQTSADREDMVLEYFADPPELDLALLPGDPPTIEGDMMVEDGLGTFGPAAAVLTVEWVGIEELEVGLGEMATINAYHLRFGLGGDFYASGDGGGVTLSSDLWLHPEQFIVRWEPGPADGPMELSHRWIIPNGA